MTVAEVLARTLRDHGVTRLAGLPGGEVLDLLEAARGAGIEFLLVRHEATASFLADALGQLQRRPAVCLSTLGPGAINMALGVANAFLDRSPMLAITATVAEAAAPYATHQHLDLHAVYRPFTKASVALDGTDTEALVVEALALASAPRMGPVHLTLASDVARRTDRRTREAHVPAVEPAVAAEADVARMVDRLSRARRPAVLIGLDLDPLADPPLVRRFVETLGVPAFVTPKAKGLLAEDHPLYAGVCAGVAADGVIVDFFARADLLVGLGYDPVESDKIWHQWFPIVSIGPLSIAARDFRPELELVGHLASSVEAVARAAPWAFEWGRAEADAVRREIDRVLRPATSPASGLSPFTLTRRLRELAPRDTIVTTDVGSVKFVVSQAWTTWEPLTFLESNGLSAMGYALPAAMAAKLHAPGRPVLCTIGDGGFAMCAADLETCVRAGLNVVTVVFNDSALSLIRVAQQKRGHADHGVGYGPIDFAAMARSLGAWGRRVASHDELEPAVADALASGRPAVIDVLVDPAEYHAHAASPRFRPA